MNDDISSDGALSTFNVYQGVLWLLLRSLHYSSARNDEQLKKQK